MLAVAVAVVVAAPRVAEGQTAAVTAAAPAVGDVVSGADSGWIRGVAAGPNPQPAEVGISGAGNGLWAGVRGAAGGPGAGCGIWPVQYGSNCTAPASGMAAGGVHEQAVPGPHHVAAGHSLVRARRPSVAGAIAGGLVGAAAGGLVACHFNRDDYDVFCGGQNDTKVAVGVVLGAAVGGTAGALIFGKPR